ncbi:RagB/SusD family nutrient uptake outer membrane protein [Hymenobacter sp. BT507]|uniref:RagB/SusD family nutrient uptake outer membrane protein n=1 Tax=Hymenobacter citatus TaxID=2763506 RepID=A0ABR7MN13_9BACT|nr:RagB/SusD family nutrient uptake outer membrane protein [Hymenobacter citatus]MBC6611953.1 RagB/SusD family nutrient uptake outer membrane protein [Hymenobacter citatus]
MKYFKTYAGLSAAVVLAGFSGCTNLDETLYDRITADNFLQTKDDVYRDFLRTFEHGYNTIQDAPYQLQELSADQLMTPNREGDWFDGGQYARAHYHTWTIQEGYINGTWTLLSQGNVLATNSLEDIQALDPARFNMTVEEQKQLIAELRVMRAWYHLRLLDLFRNIQIVTKVKGETASPPQSTPQEAFSFIEKELKEALPDLLAKGDQGTAQFQGRWSKAGAAALLARLYLNAKVYIDQDHYTDCATLCQDIISGKYGPYAIESRWDAPFDWNNDQSSETIFAFPGSFGRSHWQYTGGMYFWALPYNVPVNYFKFTDFGGGNPRYALQPGHDVENKEYAFVQGKPFVKFQKYADDVRLKNYQNLGNSTREGMFLKGYLLYNDGKDTIKSTRGYTLYLRDQVGLFKYTKPGQVPANKVSDMNNADQNSGIFMVKYPFYPSSDPHKIESDYAEIRLAEIYYMLAECRFRAGNPTAAAELLNTVRRRNYPAGSSSLYGAGGAVLTEQELLDEWGREFIGEGRRRTDLIRFGKFNSGTWWDKSPDADDHTKIYPIPLNAINVSPQLKQNPGY